MCKTLFFLSCFNAAYYELRLPFAAAKHEVGISTSDLPFGQQVLNEYHGLAALLLASSSRFALGTHPTQQVNPCISLSGIAMWKCRSASSYLLATEARRSIRRKGYEFGTKPTFRVFPTGEGTITVGSVSAPTQFAEFGPRYKFSGKLVEAQPPEANAPLINSVRGTIAVVLRGRASFENKMRYCSSAGALGVVLINSEDERFAAAPDTPKTTRSEASSIPFVVVSSSDGAKLLAGSGEATIEPPPEEMALPLFPFGKPLLPGSSLQFAVGEMELLELQERLRDSNASYFEAVIVMSKDMGIASVGTLASIELPSKTSEKNVLTAHARRPCRLRSVLRDNTPELLGLVLIDPIADSGNAMAEMESLFRKFEYEPADNTHIDPERLSFEMCNLIQLNAVQLQAALELEASDRLRALAAQYSINPNRGRELLVEAVGKADLQALSDF